jgi:hypothetical protein
MKSAVNLLIGLFILMLLAQQSIAADRYTINVIDRNRQPAEGALVTVWDGGIKSDSDYTNSNGLWDTWLESSTSYRITAIRNDQFGEIVITPGKASIIVIEMH